MNDSAWRARVQTGLKSIESKQREWIKATLALTSAKLGTLLRYQVSPEETEMGLKLVEKNMEEIAGTSRHQTRSSQVADMMLPAG